MSYPFEVFFQSVRSGGVAFVASCQGEPAYLETTGWALRDGTWHHFRDGRSPCRRKDRQRHVITSTREQLLASPSAGAQVCPRCRKQESA